MKKPFENGILIRVCKNKKELFQFVIPPNCIFITNEIINAEKKTLPVIYLTNNYEPMKAEDICNRYLGKPDDKN